MTTGTERFFEMVLISETFNDLMEKEIPSSVIWNHLDEMYDMDTLNENNSPPPELMQDTDFELPSSEFQELFAKKMEETAEETVHSNESTEKSASISKVSAPLRLRQPDSAVKNKDAASAESVKKEVAESGKGDIETPAKGTKKYSRASVNKSSSDGPSTSGKTSTTGSTKGKRVRN